MALFLAIFLFAAVSATRPRLEWIIVLSILLYLLGKPAGEFHASNMLAEPVRGG